MQSLNELAIKYGSDKSSKHHNYCEHYERHIGAFKDSEITIYELGIGGYHYPDRGGSGLRMLADYFSNSKIIGIDVHAKRLPSFREGVTIYRGSQADENFLMEVYEKEGAPHVIIDDASHMNNLTIKSFQILFPLLAPGGTYVIEDIESSWWNEHDFDGEPDIWNMEKWTTVNMLRTLINAVNRKYLPAQPKPLAPIHSIHFYPNIVFIHKSPAQ